MSPEEKFDRSIKNIIKSDINEMPSPDFTENVMERLGVRRISPAVTRPILSKWSKIAIASGYVILLAIIIYYSGQASPSDSKYMEALKWLQFPSAKSLFLMNNQIITILLVLIGGGWMLAGLDKLLKKFLLR